MVLPWSNVKVQQAGNGLRTPRGDCHQSRQRHAPCTDHSRLLPGRPPTKSRQLMQAVVAVVPGGPHAERVAPSSFSLSVAFRSRERLMGAAKTRSKAARLPRASGHTKLTLQGHRPQQGC